MHLELFWVMVLISCVPVVSVLRFFLPGAPTAFFREEYAGYVTPCWVFVVVLVASFLPSVRRLEFPLFDWGHRDSPVVTMGSIGSLCTGEAGLLAPAE
jgi:hypothetical protein